MADDRGNIAGSKRIRRIVTVVGARPQFIKAFPLSRAFRLHQGFDEILVHTGQHFNWNMSDIFFAELGIDSPRYNLNIHGGPHGAMTGRMLGALEEILFTERPAAVLVYGDTNSTLAGTLAAAKCNVPVVHIEAGLRSYNRGMPEEVNRVVVDHLSSLLLCPTSRAVENLLREGIAAGVHQVGDLMFDAVSIATPLAAQHSAVLERLGVSAKSYGVATFHRQENLENRNRIEAIVAYLQDQARSRPLVVPLHPRTREALENAGIAFGSASIVAIDPLGYLDMCQLIRSAAIVLTDSGGLQREAYFHRVPCVTLRDETEWAETVACGWNRLWTTRDYLGRREIPEFENLHTAETIFRLLDREIA
ncbi:MAG TPA: UDP-N-acetylglucosamine 2-epimerase (non-hydrolyzing) [Rhizomicrobium sp.]